MRCKPSTAETYRLTVAKHIVPALGRTPALAVGHRQVTELHHGLRQTPFMANRVVETLSRIYNTAEDRGLIPEASNPCRLVVKFRERAREGDARNGRLARPRPAHRHRHRAGDSHHLDRRRGACGRGRGLPRLRHSRRGVRRPRSSPCPGRTPGCARARRHRGTGSRRWKPSWRGFARPEQCCRKRSTAARASSRTNRARSASAVSSAARAATAAPNGPGSRSAPKSTTRRPMRASADGAGSPMRRTAPRNPPSSRSRSRPTSA